MNDEGLEGPNIVRHETRIRDFEPAVGDQHLIDAISNHVERHVGPVEKVFHEIMSDMVHVDIHWVQPSPQRPFHTLVTSGMSERPMCLPEGYDGPEYAEMCAVLPESWHFPGLAEEQAGETAIERLYWPVRWLKILSRLPHEYETFVAYGHTVPNGDPPAALADNVRFDCVMATLPYCFDPAFASLELPDRRVSFLAMVPLFPEETRFKLKNGCHALERRWEKARVPFPLMFDPARPNVCRRRFFGFW